MKIYTSDGYNLMMWDKTNGNEHTQILISKYKKDLLFKFPSDKEQPSPRSIERKNTHTNLEYQKYL